MFPPNFKSKENISNKRPPNSSRNQRWTLIKSKGWENNCLFLKKTTRKDKFNMRGKSDNSSWKFKKKKPMEMICSIPSRIWMTLSEFIKTSRRSVNCWQNKTKMVGARSIPGLKNSISSPTDSLKSCLKKQMRSTKFWSRKKKTFFSASKKNSQPFPSKSSPFWKRCKKIRKLNWIAWRRLNSKWWLFWKVKRQTLRNRIFPSQK